jgi:hypothetical protein
MYAWDLKPEGTGELRRKASTIRGGATCHFFSVVSLKTEEKHREP